MNEYPNGFSEYTAYRIFVVTQGSLHEKPPLEGGGFMEIVDLTREWVVLGY
tara:strand:- start:999 stop:1151 length:153 start_codon:yes stop_codon:yes gene_type:complete